MYIEIFYCNKPLWYLIVFVLLFIQGTRSSYSFELIYEYEAGTEYTDNSRLKRNNKEDELSIIVSAGFSLSDSLRRINYSITPSVTQIEYTNDTFSDNTYYKLESNLIWDILPSTLSWQVNNDLSVQEIDSFASNTPSNSQQVNIFSTGPSVEFRLSTLNTLLVNYTYSDIKNEKTKTDNKRKYYDIIIEHKVSPTSSVSLNYTDRTVRYKDKILNTDNDTSSTFIQFDSRKARSDYQLVIGENKAKRISDRVVTKGRLLRLSWNYTLNYNTNVSLRFRKELSDSINDINISNNEGSGVLNSADKTVSGIFETERLNLSFQKESTNFQIYYSIFGERQDYKEITRLQKIIGNTIAVEYNATNKLSLTGRIFYSAKKNIETNEIKLIDTRITIGTMYTLSNRVNLYSRLANNNRESNNIGDQYNENVVSIGLTYSGQNLQRRRN